MLQSPRLIVRVLAVVVVVGVLSFWAMRGAHTGWSMDKVPTTLTDEITGLTYTAYEDRYVPGIEILGGGLLAGAGLFGVSYLLGRPTPSKSD